MPTREPHPGGGQARYLWRKVLRAQRRMNPGWEKSPHVGGRYKADLDCGHSIHRKLSAGLPARVRCTHCEGLRSGSTVTLSNPDGSTTRETWDPESLLPKRETIAAVRAEAP